MAKAYCPSCGVKMEYAGGGYWECPDCGDEEYKGYDEDGESTEEAMDEEDAELYRKSRGYDEDDNF